MNVLPIPLELFWIWPGIALFTGAAGLAIAAATPGTAQRALDRGVLGLFAAALGLLAVGIAVRWTRLGHGPFLSLFEILVSSLVTLGVGYALAWWRLPSIRRSAAIVLPLLAVMAVWLLVASPADTHFPPTYETSVLWFHVLFGKLFLACALVALGLAGVVIARMQPRFAASFSHMPADAALDRLAWRFMRIALVFESLMLVAGAVWAQDAWGRYWAWDPLETWAFVTWLALVGALHARLRYHLGPRAGALCIVIVFVLAFLTFFGVPFVSTAPHKGAI